MQVHRQLMSIGLFSISLCEISEYFTPMKGFDLHTTEWCNKE